MSEDGKNVVNSGAKPHIVKLEGAVPDAESAATFVINDLQAWKRIYELCIELRNFEILQLVQRNNFFMIFQGVLLAGVCQSAAQVPVVSFMICLVGFVISLLQAGMASGAKYWQSHWEINTKNAEKEMTGMLRIHGKISERIIETNVVIDPALRSKLQRRKMLVHLFQNEYNLEEIRASLGKGILIRPIINKLILWRCSASRIPIYAGLFLACAWFTLLMCTIKFDGINIGVFDFIVGFKARGQ